MNPNDASHTNLNLSQSDFVTERSLESDFLRKLADLGYTIRTDIHDRALLERNFRDRFQSLNQVKLTDAEFQRLLTDICTPDVYQASQRLRNINTIERDDGTSFHYTLVNIKDWCKNNFEVVHQLRINTYSSHHRYDVILLINGIPVVQIELKKLGISPRRAMQQIVEYKSDPGNGYSNTLLCFMQLFVVSNLTQTYYFTNNNPRHFCFNAEERFLPIYRFALEDNKKVTHLHEFADKFLAKCTLGQMISRYMVLIANEQKLLMMRPYQIYAVQRIVRCIEENSGNGYIWHTTGSGKTLTSFKAATLLKDKPEIHKCVFVVDRMDLDRQTREEFNRFQEGCVEENTNTAMLVKRLLSEDYADKVIVTTIQKLGLALDEQSKRNKQREKHGKETFSNRLAPLRNKRMVFIFDECHRSQFGSTHKTIKDFFPDAQFFGFTGTPIFEENSTAWIINGQEQKLLTTIDIFQQELHSYTITHAIEDENVLPFHVDYYKHDGKNLPKPNDPITKKTIVESILEKHDTATDGRRFNALLATASINDAIEYYELFQTIQTQKATEVPNFVPLKVAAVFTPPPDVSSDVRQLQEDLPQEQEDNRVEPERKKSALEKIINDYNQRYATNYNVYMFDDYYKDVQQRIKDQQHPNNDLPQKGKEKIDLTIVVDMLLTGFDSKYLYTLYVDKNLKYHSLIQAFSRTNRILNGTKPYGNIVDFRGQNDRVDEAIVLFSGVAAEKARQIWLVESAANIIEKLKTQKEALNELFAEHNLEPKPESVANLRGDEARTQFIHRFKEVQRLITQLNQHTGLTEEQQQQIEAILPRVELLGFRAAYLETAKRLRDQEQTTSTQELPSDVQLDFELVLFASTTIDYDYIIRLIARFTAQNPNELKITRDQLIGLIKSDAKFLDEGDLISDYVRTLEAGKPLNENQVREGYLIYRSQRQEEELTQIAAKHGLDAQELKRFVDDILSRKIFDAEKLSELVQSLKLIWSKRFQCERELMKDLVPLLKKRSGGQPISGLRAYEEGRRWA